MATDTDISRERIAEIEPIIRPYIRHTPSVTVDLADFGLEPRAATFKLDLPSR